MFDPVNRMPLPELGAEDGSNAGTVLVVDDERRNRDLLRALLEAYHYEVLEAENGEKALAAVRDHGPDVVLLDVMMPGLNGFDVCAAINRDPVFGHIPVILITALSGREDRLAGIRAGASDFLTKPIDAHEVVLRVRNSVRLKRLHDSAVDQIREINELQALRDGMVQMLVHDLRSPLLGIISSLDLLSTLYNSSLPEQGQRLMGNLSHSAEVMVEMVSSMLDVSRIEDGRFRLAPREVMLPEIMDEAMQRLGGMPDGIRIVQRVEDGAERGTLDPELMVRVLVNLLHNAVRYSPEGESIDLVCRSVEGGLRIEVLDRGPGVPEETRAHLFDKYNGSQANGNGQGKHARYSTGLGLAFCRLAVDAHSGRIGYQDREGGGSAFWLELPQGRG